MNCNGEIFVETALFIKNHVFQLYIYLFTVLVQGEFIYSFIKSHHFLRGAHAFNKNSRI